MAATITVDMATNLNLGLSLWFLAMRVHIHCTTHTYCDTGLQFIGVSSNIPVPMSHSGIHTHDAMIIRSLRHWSKKPLRKADDFQMIVLEKMYRVYFVVWGIMFLVRPSVCPSVSPVLVTASPL